MARWWLGVGLFLRVPEGQACGLTDLLSVLADVLRFDNTYSLMFAKKISYTVEVLLPDKASAEKIQSFEAKTTAL